MSILKTVSYFPTLAAVIWVCNMELVVQFGFFAPYYRSTTAEESAPY